LLADSKGPKVAHSSNYGDSHMTTTTITFMQRDDEDARDSVLPSEQHASNRGGHSEEKNRNQSMAKKKLAIDIPKDEFEKERIIAAEVAELELRTSSKIEMDPLLGLTLQS
jgi:hypothetical protein